MCNKWLAENAGAPIKYILTNDKNYIPEVLENFEVKYWLSKLKDRADNKDLSNIHGSHDYRYEIIVKNCAILGLSKYIPSFDENIKYVLDFLNRHIKNKDIEQEKLSFGKMYAYRDYETVLACYLPELGYQDDEAVRYIAEKRINITYNFTKQKRYDIYVDGSKFKGVKREWQPYIINPELYSDGNIALPSYHDYILFAGIYKYLGKELQRKVDNTIEWLFSDEYIKLKGRYGYFYAEGGNYNAKAILVSLKLLDFKNILIEKEYLSGLLNTVYILSHFKTVIKHDWFNMALAYLNDYKISDGLYKFPSNMIMNIGENKKAKKYREIVSTYWMYRINKNLK